MGRAVAVAVLALCACHRAPARIYTDNELADLEQRVLAEVAKTDVSCSHHELLDIETAVDEPCRSRMSLLRGDLDPESSDVAKIDEQCAAKVLAVFGRAAATSPGCSPYQVGVRGEMVVSKRNEYDGFVGAIHATKVLAWHALRETDHYVGLMELFMALGVAQDFERGRIDLLAGGMGDGIRNTILWNTDTLLSMSSLTPEQLADAATMLDAMLSHEPTYSDALQGEAVTMALHLGVARLKPKEWQPPGGRTVITASNDTEASSGHDRRDDAGALMDTGLHRLARLEELCPASASLADCHANLRAHDTPTDWDSNLTDMHAVRVAMFPDDKTRRESKEQIVARGGMPDFLEDFVSTRAVAVTRLVALRLRLQVLIDGHCPSEAQLTAPPWSTLRAPAVLGDSVQVTRKTDAILITAPVWATTTTFVPRSPPFPPPLPKPKPVTIPCP